LFSFSTYTSGESLLLKLSLTVLDDASKVVQLVSVLLVGELLTVAVDIEDLGDHIVGQFGH